MTADRLLRFLESNLRNYAPREVVLDEDFHKSWAELQDPILSRFFFESGSALSVSQLWSCDTLLLGEAQSGKSSVLRSACFQNLMACQNQIGQQVRTAWLDLGADLDHNFDLSHPFSIIRRDFGPQPGTVFIDSVDEPTRVKGPGFIRGLLSALDTYLPQDRIILASRRWAVEDFLHSNKGGRIFRKVTTDALDIRFYGHFFDDVQERDEFFGEINRLSLGHLLRRALDGIGLVRYFLTYGQLPRSRAELFDHRIKDSFSSFSSTKRPSEILNPKLLEEGASILAIEASIGDRISWTAPTAFEAISQIDIEGKLYSGPIVSSLLGTSLFRSGLPSDGEDVKWSFARDEDRERLAARRLSRLPLRKLKSVVAGNGSGIAPERRGLAQQLATFNHSFREWLQCEDPLGALMTEQIDELLDPDALEKFFELVSRMQVVPWQNIPPSDFELGSILHFRRPADPDGFLEKWLASDSEISRLWAATAASIWKTTEKSNPVLLELALDESQNTKTRQAAVIACASTQRRELLLPLTKLHWSRDSEARAEFIRAYLQLRTLSPLRILCLFNGGQRQNILGMMYRRASDAAGHIPPDSLDQALAFVTPRKSKFDDLWSPLILALLESAKKRKAELSAQSLYELLALWDSERADDAVVDYLKVNPGPLSCLLELAFSNKVRGSDIFGILLNLGPALLLKHLPPGFSPEIRRGLVDRQASEARGNSGATSADEPAPSELDEFVQVLVSGQVELGLSPQAVAAQLIRHISPSRQRLVCELPVCSNQTEDAIRNILFVALSDWAHQPLVAQAGQYLDPSFEGVRQQKYYVLAFALNVELQMHLRESYFSTYGFHALNCSQCVENAANQLKAQHPACWDRAVDQALSSPLTRTETISYLKRNRSTKLADEAREKLTNPGAVRAGELEHLMDYWQGLSLPDYAEVAFAFYRNLPPQEISNLHYLDEILLSLCDLDYGPAWSELSERINRGDFPRPSSRRRRIPTPPADVSPKYVLWFNASSRIVPDPNDWNELPALILRAISGLATRLALECLQQMIDSCEVDWAKRLAAKYFFEVRYGRGEVPPTLFSRSDLSKLLGDGWLVSSEGVLFETILEALEQESIRYLQGEGIEGFWNHSKGIRTDPKGETLCQNLLWHNIRTRLENLRVFSIKERFVGSDRVDFFCEVGAPDGPNLVVPVELKATSVACRNENFAVDWLVNRMESQLYQKYMVPSGSRHGIFVVLWFKGDDWSFSDADWADLRSFQLQQRQLASSMKIRLGVSIQPVIIDVSVGSSDHRKPKKEKSSTRKRRSGLKKGRP